MDNYTWGSGSYVRAARAIARERSFITEARTARRIGTALEYRCVRWILCGARYFAEVKWRDENFLLCLVLCLIVMSINLFKYYFVVLSADESR